MKEKTALNRGQDRQRYRAFQSVSGSTIRLNKSPEVGEEYMMCSLWNIALLSEMARKLLTNNKDKTMAVVNHQVLDLLKSELLAEETESIRLQVTAYGFQGNTRVILIIRQEKAYYIYTLCFSDWLKQGWNGDCKFSLPIQSKLTKRFTHFSAKQIVV